MKDNKILVIALLSNKKLKDKLIPLKEAFPKKEIFVLRKKSGFMIDKITYITIPKFLSNNHILSTLFIFLKGIFIIPRLNPSVIISYFFIPYGIISLILGKFYQKKVICSIIGSDQFFFEKKILSGLYIRFLMEATAIVVTGTKSKQKFRRLIDKNMKIQYIPNTTKINIQKTVYEKRDIDFIFIGNLIPLKQVHVIIKAFINLSDELNLHEKKSNKKLPNLYILGEGPEKERLENIVKKSNFPNNIFFTGYQKDVNRYLIRSKFILLASTNEGLPVVLIEGMMKGCIPITTNVGDIGDLMTEKNGFFVEYSQGIDEEVLISQFKEIMNFSLNIPKNKFETLSNFNIETIKRYDFSFGGKFWKQLIDEL